MKEKNGYYVEKKIIWLEGKRKKCDFEKWLEIMEL